MGRTRIYVACFCLTPTCFQAIWNTSTRLSPVESGLSLTIVFQMLLAGSNVSRKISERWAWKNSATPLRILPNKHWTIMWRSGPKCRRTIWWLQLKDLQIYVLAKELHSQLRWKKTGLCLLLEEIYSHQRLIRTCSGTNFCGLLQLSLNPISDCAQTLCIPGYKLYV